MKEFLISKNDAGQRLDRFVTKVVPALPSSLVHKYIRLKRIKVNNKGSKQDRKLFEGDVVQMYISDKFLETSFIKSKKINPDTIAFDLDRDLFIDIIYEDENILIINKPSGILCYDTRGLIKNTLINNIQAYITHKDEWQPQNELTFSPALCNRIDRNTSGIVIAAKNAETLRIINDKIKNKEIDKYYLTIVHGIPNQKDGQLTGYISKDGKRNLVKVTENEIPDSKLAETEYRVLATKDDGSKPTISLLECKLITGRTHQIRAQLANIGHPILGDIKYGNKQINEPFNETHQVLCSYKIIFSFKTDVGALNYLNGMSFEVKDIPFVDKYFQKK